MVVCVNAANSALPKLIENAVFVANVLKAGQAQVADAFAGFLPDLPREHRFSIGGWQAMATGAPALAGALCSFDCRVAAIFAFGSHRIIAGEVVAVATAPGEPLVYSGRAYRKLEAA